MKHYLVCIKKVKNYMAKNESGAIAQFKKQYPGYDRVPDACFDVEELD